MTTPPHWANRPKSTPPLRPRRVRGGEKLAETAGPESGSWASQRWSRLIEQAAAGPALVEGLEYAKSGQTKRLSFGSGTVEGIVQGRNYRPYTTTLKIDIFDHAQWDQAIAAMSDQALYAAKLLAGELPPNVEDVFAPLMLKLCPTEPAEVRPTCTCAEGVQQRGIWCKHACCVALLLADRLGRDPFLMFTLRGLGGEELVERLRQRRTVLGAAGSGSVSVYQARVPGVSELAPTPLEESLNSFWELGPELRELDVPLEPPEVTHPLLRRLGPSPFQGPAARFPLVGLLATCYDIASTAALRTTEPGPPADQGTAGAQEPPPDLEQP